MPKGPIRRGQLISPFGVGAMVVVKDGTALVTAGLDYWYRREDGNDPSLQALEEFKVEEWRLQRLLGVDHFRVPPDWREGTSGAHVPNPYMTVPFLRFPTWHFCRRCQNMKQVRPQEKGKVECEECKIRHKRSEAMAQVPFIAVCDHGHLQDFPWREWVHSDPKPSCMGTLKLSNTGGASLAAQLVTCSCGATRNLSGITGADREESEDGTVTYKTFLSSRLTEGTIYTCHGHRAWFGFEAKDQDCGRHIRGSLRSALNVYFADLRSAIYLPRGSGGVPSGLLEALREPMFSGMLSMARMLAQVGNFDVMTISTNIIGMRPTLEAEYGRQAVDAAVLELVHEDPTVTTVPDEADKEEDEVAFRYDEHRALREPREEKHLLVRQQDPTQYGDLGTYFARVALVEKLRETRVLNGFTRISPSSLPGMHQRRAMMWRDPGNRHNNWLPAQVVHGEGIYLELDEARLAAWERHPKVISHTQQLAERYDVLAGQRGSQLGKVTPRFLLVHTLSHLLMNQLTFSCGYSSATLRERVYVSAVEETAMAGLLIYTADGDADGTLGGLVRMGKPGYFEDLVRQAVANATWCSADPICMEAGQNGGQGPDSLNLAACHSCALVPETACEEFNRLLDRTVVVGTMTDSSLGFFGPLVNV